MHIHSIPDFNYQNHNVHLELLIYYHSLEYLKLEFYYFNVYFSIYFYF